MAAGPAATGIHAVVLSTASSASSATVVIVLIASASSFCCTFLEYSRIGSTNQSNGSCDDGRRRLAVRLVPCGDK